MSTGAGAAAAAVAQAIKASGAIVRVEPARSIHLPGDAELIEARTMWIPP
jgi:hypothetical protein